MPGWDPRGNPEVRRIEEVWEAVREAEFPHRPSRLGAVFVCRKRVGFCDPHSWPGGQVYEVEVRGRVFVANSECFTEAREAASRGDWERVESWGRQYWAARGSVMDILEEVVVDGRVTVIREAPDASARRVARRYLAGTAFSVEEVLDELETFTRSVGHADPDRDVLWARLGVRLRGWRDRLHRGVLRDQDRADIQRAIQEVRAYS